MVVQNDGTLVLSREKFGMLGGVSIQMISIPNNELVVMCRLVCDGLCGASVEQIPVPDHGELQVMCRVVCGGLGGGSRPWRVVAVSRGVRRPLWCFCRTMSGSRPWRVSNDLSADALLWARWWFPTIALLALCRVVYGGLAVGYSR